MGAKPFFKIFQVSFPKGTEGLKQDNPGAFLWQETTKRSYTKVNKNGVGLITPSAVRNEDSRPPHFCRLALRLFSEWSI